jgi:hypothetical protein
MGGGYMPMPVAWSAMGQASRPLRAKPAFTPEGYYRVKNPLTC